MTVKQKTGIVVKNYNGYYYVQTQDEVVPSKLRGRLKKERFSLLTGDRVVITRAKQDGEGSIEEILPRRNRLLKPAVANVDQIVLAFALKNPEFNQNILDRFLVTAEQSQVPIIICLTKSDLLADSSEREQIVALYEKIGYLVVTVSVKTNQGLGQLKCLLKHKTTVFAGLSGAGKSSLLNALYPSLELATGQVSSKNSRGKHTTRFSQLLFADDGYIVDTPGYSFAELMELPAQQIEQAFPEFAKCSADCRFSSCLHAAEPACAVKQAVQAGEIDETRYDNYLTLLKESQEAEERKYK